MQDGITWKLTGLTLWLFSTFVSLWRLSVNASYYNRLNPRFSKSNALCNFVRLFWSDGYGDVDSFRIRRQNLWFHVFSFMGSVCEVPKVRE